MGKKLGVLVVILFGYFVRGASREACHDYYRGQQWKPAWCPQFCCGTHSYRYCCDDCRESIYTHSCERPRDVEVPRYSSEAMFIAGMCGVTGVGIVVVFCTATLITRYLLRRRGRGRRRRSQARNPSGRRTEPDSAIPPGVTPGEKSKMLPPPLYDNTDTAPSGITPPPAYMPIVTPDAVSRALIRISLNYPALMDNSSTSHNRTSTDRRATHVPQRQNTLEDLLSTTRANRRTLNAAQRPNTEEDLLTTTQDFMAPNADHDNGNNTSRSILDDDDDSLSEYRRMAEIEQVLVTALTLPPPYEEVQGERF